MRDVLLMGFIICGSLYALRRPWIGVILWTWVSLMNPHEQFAYQAANWPVASTVAICTLIGLAFTKDRENPFMGSPVWALLGFCVWICITLPFSFYFDESYPLWLRSIKIFLMIFVSIALLDTKAKLDLFIWVAVISLGYYGVKGAVFTVATGGEYRVWGPGGFIEGNNELALALVMTIPLMRYLQTQATRRIVRTGLGIAMAMTSITVLGSQSRGALLALGGMAAMFWLKSDRKVKWGVAILVVGTAILSFMPETWWDRMDTIKTYEEDGSALGRINAWWVAWNVARDRFFGGGFMMWNDPVFLKYAPVPDDVHAAHSIYMQVLGEHGFVGLAIFLLIGLLTWRTARRLIVECADLPERRWGADLGAMVQVGLIGYAVGGAFLSLAYFDLPYDLMLAVVAARGMILRSSRVRKTVSPYSDQRGMEYRNPAPGAKVAQS